MHELAGLRKFIRIVEVQDSPAVLTCRPVIVFGIVSHQRLEARESHGSGPREVGADFHAMLEAVPDGSLQ